MISESGLDWPMGSIALYRHCAHRPELERLPSFSTEEEAGSRKTSVWISFGFMPGTFPERAGLVVEEVDVDHPFELGKRLPGLVGIRARTGRVLAPGKEPLELAFHHLVEEHEP